MPYDYSKGNSASQQMIVLAIVAAMIVSFTIGWIVGFNSGIIG